MRIIILYLYSINCRCFLNTPHPRQWQSQYLCVIMNKRYKNKNHVEPRKLRVQDHTHNHNGLYAARYGRLWARWTNSSSLRATVVVEGAECKVTVKAKILCSCCFGSAPPSLRQRTIEAIPASIQSKSAEDGRPRLRKWVYTSHAKHIQVIVWLVLYSIHTA